MPLETPDQANSASGFQREPSPDEVASMSPSQKSAYWHTKLATLMSKVGTAKDPKTAQPGDLTTADLGELIANARSEADQADKMVQQGTTDATAQQRADTTAANDAAARTETNRHNVHEEGIAQQNANETAGYHAQSLGIQGQLAQISAQNEAIRAKAEQDTAAAKGDANKIALARLQYEQSMASQTAKLQTLKDQVTSLSGMDNNDVTNQVSQADSRNTDALSMTDKAATLVGGMKGITDPNLAASAMGSLMNAGQQYSAQSGGAPVPVGQLTDQHKAEITQLVMAGMPFNQAVQQAAAKEAAAQAAGPQPGGVNPTQPGYVASGGGGMGIVGQNTGGGGGPGYTVPIDVDLSAGHSTNSGPGPGYPAPGMVAHNTAGGY